MDAVWTIDSAARWDALSLRCLAVRRARCHDHNGASSGSKANIGSQPATSAVGANRIGRSLPWFRRYVSSVDDHSNDCLRNLVLDCPPPPPCQQPCVAILANDARAAAPLAWPQLLRNLRCATTVCRDGSIAVSELTSLTASTEQLGGRIRCVIDRSRRLLFISGRLHYVPRA